MAFCLDVFTRVTPLTRRVNAPRQVPSAARHAVESAFSATEIADSVAPMGGHHFALICGYINQLERPKWCPLALSPPTWNRCGVSPNTWHTGCAAISNCTVPALVWRTQSEKVGRHRMGGRRAATALMVNTPFRIGLSLVSFLALGLLVVNLRPQVTHASAKPMAIQNAAVGRLDAEPYGALCAGRRRPAQRTHVDHDLIASDESMTTAPRSCTRCLEE
jgi:hypothetical protein